MGFGMPRGYSKGAQKGWLEKELAAARRDNDIDWIVVCMHQVAISTVDKFNGADLGIRQEWGPLFDRYGVDLVVCGHEHHYERSHPIRGFQSNATLTPVPAATATDVIDTTKAQCTWSSAAAERPFHRTSCSSTRQHAESSPPSPHLIL
jgi:3',5'-cyclic AMP phosphodiesterase CpdA